MEEILLEFAAKALNISQDEVKQILEDESTGGLETLVQKDAARIKATKDAGYKSAERKINASWEGKLQSTFGVQSDTKGPELIDEVNEAIEAKEAEQKPTKEVTEAQIKKHPDYLRLEKQLQDAEKTFEEKLKNTVAEKEEAFTQRELFGEFKTFALDFIDNELKLNLSTDANRARAQKNDLMEKIEAKFKIQKEGDSYVFIDKATDERVNNAQGYPITDKELVKNVATTYYDPQVAEARTSSARKPDESTTTPTAVTVPKNREEYAKYLDSDATPQEKTQVMELYHSQS